MLRSLRLTPSSSLSLAAGIVLAGMTGSFGCGDDTTGSGGSGGASSSAAQGSGSTTASSSTTTGSTTGGGDGGGVSSGETTTSGGGAGGAGTGGTGAGGGEPSACDDLPDGPLAPTLLSSDLDGSEDIALDGLGHLAGKQGGQMVLLDADGVVTPLAAVPAAFGTRFANDGSLVVALPNDNEVIAIDAEGSVTTLAGDLDGPNGIHITSDGTVWVTEFSGARIQTIPSGGGEAELFLDGAATANGIFVDEDRGIVFYTNYSAGQLWRVDQAGTEEPSLVGSVAGALFDGLTMDVCGNVYAVDQGNDRIYRLRTDAAGDLVGEPELLATLPTNVANAQFGRGEGFSPTTLYAAGNPGDVYALDVGVEGAEQAGP